MTPTSDMEAHYRVMETIDGRYFVEWGMGTRWVVVHGPTTRLTDVRRWMICRLQQVRDLEVAERKPA